MSAIFHRIQSRSPVNASDSLPPAAARATEKTVKKRTDNERREKIINSKPEEIKAQYLKHLGPKLAKHMASLPAVNFQLFSAPAAEAILQAEKLGLHAEFVTGKLPQEIVKLFQSNFDEKEGIPIADLEKSHQNNSDRSRYFAFTISKDNKNIGFAQGFRVGNGFLIEYVAVDKAYRQKGVLKNFVSFTAGAIAEGGEKSRSTSASAGVDVEHVVSESERVGQGDTLEKRAATFIRSDIIFGPMGAQEYLIQKNGKLHPLYSQVADQEKDKNGNRLESQTLAFSSFPIPRDEKMPAARPFDVEGALQEVVHSYENRPGLDVPAWKRENAQNARDYTSNYLYDENGEKAEIISIPLQFAPSHIELAKYFPEFAREVIDNFHLKIDKKMADSESGRKKIACLANAVFIKDLTLIDSFYDYKGKAKKLEERLVKRLDQAISNIDAPRAAAVRERARVKIPGFTSTQLSPSSESEKVTQLKELAVQLKSAPTGHKRIAVVEEIGMASEPLNNLTKALVKALRSQQAIEYRLNEASKDQADRLTTLQNFVKDAAHGLSRSLARTAGYVMIR